MFTTSDPTIAHLNSSRVELKNLAYFSIHLLKVLFPFSFLHPSACVQIDMMYTQRMLKLIILQLFLLTVLAIGPISVMQ